MWSFYPWYHLPVIASGLLSIALALYAWRFRTTPGTRPTFAFLVFLAIWSLGSAVEIGAPDLATRCLLNKIEYLGIAYISVAWFAVALEYLGYGYCLTARNLSLLCVIPTIAIILNWTNSYHHWFYSHIAMGYSHGMPVFDLTYAPGFWIYAGYSYLLCVAALLLCLQAITKASAIYRRQAMLIFCCASLPLLFNVAYLTHMPLLGFMDLSPLAFACSAGLILWGVVNYRLLKLAPIAYRMIVESIADGVIVLDAFKHVVEINPTACRMLGLPHQAILPGTLAAFPPAWACLADLEMPRDREGTHLITCEGMDAVYEVRVMPVKTTLSGDVGSIILLRDITESRRLETQLQAMAFFDPLTGLPNRALFFDRMKQALASSARQMTKIALLYLDLDQFKRINDSMGHAMGDELLRQVAQRLRAQVRESDTLARLGGDEFVIILTDLDDDFDPAIMISRVLQTFTAPFLLGDTPISITTSIGVAIAPTDGEDLDQLLSHADHAMYAVKQQHNEATAAVTARRGNLS